MKKKKKKVNNLKLKNDKFLKTNFFILCIFIIVLIITLITNKTYSLWTKTYSQNDVSIIESGCFALKISDLNENKLSTSIKLLNTYPMTDETGLSNLPYVLKIENICDIPSEYNVLLNVFNNTSLDLNYIKYQIKRENIVTLQKLLDAERYEIDKSIKDEINKENINEIKETYTLANGYLEPSETANYELRLWLDYNATNDTMNKYFEAGIFVLSNSPQ